jgi:hypothetical protein
MREFIREFVQYVGRHKKLWLIPAAIVVLLITAALLMTQSNALAPFVYPQ